MKKTVVKLELLTNVDMLQTIKKGIRGGLCHAIHRYVKANNKCMKLPADGFKWEKICQCLVKNL